MHQGEALIDHLQISCASVPTVQEDDGEQILVCFTEGCRFASPKVIKSVRYACNCTYGAKKICKALPNKSDRYADQIDREPIGPHTNLSAKRLDL